MGGYPAAIRASQLGLKVALVESDKLGGTCLHIGCIPTKALLESSELYHRVATRGSEFGLKAEVVGYDYPRIAERRDAVVNQLYKGVQYLMKKNKIEVVEGKGRLRDRNTIEVGAKQVKGKNLIVATGSVVKTRTRARCGPTSCSWQWAAPPCPKSSASSRRACSCTRTGSSRSTSGCARRSTPSTPSATSSAAICSRMRRRTRGSWPPKTSPGSDSRRWSRPSSPDALTHIRRSHRSA